MAEEPSQRPLYPQEENDKEPLHTCLPCIRICMPAIPAAQERGRLVLSETDSDGPDE